MRLLFYNLSCLRSFQCSRPFYIRFNRTIVVTYRYGLLFASKSQMLSKHYNGHTKDANAQALCDSKYGKAAP